ncbi:MAG: 2OG-Fe(II) oxygenase [Caulobacterales bacterium]
METKVSAAPAAEAGAAVPTIRDRLLVIDDFLPVELAEAMRLDIDNHFSNPAAHAAETHQVWNYWYVPPVYTYFRTQPEKVIEKASVDAFMDRLRFFTTETLGLARVNWPYLSLYVDGCKQGLHNDAHNGRFGYVYSLTRNERRTSGGETIVHHEGDPFRNGLVKPLVARGFYDAIAPRFNRLVIFDDRMPHAVERIEGSMDPKEGRFVMHGHIREGGPAAGGALPFDEVAPKAVQAVHAFVRESSIPLTTYHGPVTLRLDIRPDGSVQRCQVLLDRVFHADPADARWPELLKTLVERLEALTFPPAAGETHLLLPVLFGQMLVEHDAFT